MNVHVEVTCPGDTGFTWQVALDSFSGGQIIMEQTTPVFDFTLRQFADRISNGRHDLWLRVRCGSEGWDQATTGKTTFDWNGGNPPPVNPPAPGSGCNISLNPGNSTVPANTSLNFTATTSCATGTMTTRFFVNGTWVYELGSQVAHYTWPGAGSGSYQVCAQGRNDSDPNWERAAQACATVTVSGAINVPQPGNVVTNPEANPPQPQNNGGPGLPRYGEARQPGVNGGVDVIVYCYAAGYTGATNRDNTRNGWGCTISNGQSFIPLDWTNVCHDVWGSNYSYDIGNGGPNDIRCVPGQGRQTLPQNQGGQSPQPTQSRSGVRVQPGNTVVQQPNRGSGAACSVTEPVRVGGQGRVTPGTANRLRSGPGLGYSQIGSMPGGAEFSVIGGPECNDSYRWWQVNYNGTVGWTADGDNNEYWIVGVGQQVVQNSGSESNFGSDESTVNLYYQPFNQSYNLRINTRTCTVVNGSEVVATEIGRFIGWMQSMNQLARLDGVRQYFFENSGAIEGLRRFFEANVGCQNPRYQVGSRFMDMSGLGNIMFGYYSTWYPTEVEDVIANWAQAGNENSPWQFVDNYDDETQRRTGRSIANSIGNSAPTPSRVEQAARDNALQ